MKTKYTLCISALVLMAACTKRIVEPSLTKVENLKYEKDTLYIQESQTVNSGPLSFTGPGPVSFQLNCTPSSDQITIDEKGIITTNKNLLPNIYNLTITATNPAGKSVFKNALVVKMNAPKRAPGDFFYTPNTFSLKVNQAQIISEPNITYSSTEPVAFSYIEKTTGKIVPGITILENGSFSIAGLPNPGTYLLDVTAANSVGKAKTTLTINVVLPALPQIEFENNNFNLEKNGMDCIMENIIKITGGSLPIKFDFDVALNGMKKDKATSWITINPKNGSIRIKPAAESGIYTLTIYAENDEGKTSFPIRFSYFPSTEFKGSVSYKSNIDIKKGSQAAIPDYSADNNQIYEFSINAGSGITIDKYTGFIHADYTTPTGTYIIKTYVIRPYYFNGGSEFTSTVVLNNSFMLRVMD